MQQSHPHAVRPGQPSLESFEAGLPGGSEKVRAAVPGVSRLRAAIAWLLLSWVGTIAPAVASAQVVTGSSSSTELVATLASDSTTLSNLRSATPLAARTFRSMADSMEFETARAAATKATGLRVVVSMFDRELYVLDNADTLLVAPVAVAVDTTLAYNGRSWRFETPRGKRRVLSKQANPVWVPPEWHYAEVASRQGLQLARLERGRTVSLADGRKLVVRGDRVGTLDGSTFTALPRDEEIIFDGVIYVPPANTVNRQIEGELGKYKLALGDGFLLHGTPHTESIGTAATHGCVRLLDEDVEWLYDQIPVGTAVYIY